MNMVLKSKIDSFRRLHQKRLADLKAKLGIEASQHQFEAIVKAKQGDREYRAAKEHKEYVEKTETVSKVNGELEEKIEAMKAEIEEDEIGLAGGGLGDGFGGGEGFVEAILFGGEGRAEETPNLVVVFDDENFGGVRHRRAPGEEGRRGVARCG